MKTVSYVLGCLIFLCGVRLGEFMANDSTCARCGVSFKISENNDTRMNTKRCFLGN